MFQKFFQGHGSFGGIVVSYTHSPRSPALQQTTSDFFTAAGAQFHILYDDGDEEDISCAKLAGVVVLPNSRSASVDSTLSCRTSGAPTSQSHYSIIFGPGRIGLALIKIADRAFVVGDDAKQRGGSGVPTVSRGHVVCEVAAADAETKLVDGGCASWDRQLQLEAL